MSEISHESVFFTGHVQGVGFRYSTLQVAKEFEVTGFVRNLDDGRVELQVEGAGSEIDRFIETLNERMHGHIRKAERTRQTRARQFSGFTIR